MTEQVVQQDVLETNNKKTKKKVKKSKLVNFKTSSVILMTFIIIFRVLMIFYWLIAPILVTLAVVYDDGMRHLIEFINATLFNDDGITKVHTLVISILAPCLWLFTFIVICFLFQRPFYKKKEWRERAYLSFSMFFWAILLIGVIYIIYFVMPFFPHEKNEAQENYFNGLIKTFKPWSIWMIVLQVMHLFLLIFGIFSAIEAHMKRILKLDYSDFMYKGDDSKSLMSQVLEGKIDFGQHEAKDLNIEIKKLRKELDVEEQERRYQQRLAYEEQRKAKKDAKKTKSKS